MGISASNTGRIWANADLKVDALALDSSTTPLSDAGDAKGQTLGPQQASQVRLSSRDHSGQSGWLGRTTREDNHGSFKIMRRAQTSKPTLWCWQQRYLGKGVSGLKRDKAVQAYPPNAVH